MTERPLLEAAIVERVHASFARQGAMATLGAELADVSAGVVPEAWCVRPARVAAEFAPRTFFRYFPCKEDVLFADHTELVALIRDTLATRSADESVIDAVRRAILAGLEKVVADPSLFLTRAKLAASVPAAQAHSRYLDGDYEQVIAEAVAASRNGDPATDLQARLIAKAAWSANRAAREIWFASEAKRDPRQLINEAFDLLDNGLRQS